MTKKIIFRADGNSTTGLGHLYRLFSLVEMIKETINFVFLTRENSSVSVIPDGYTIKTIPIFVTIDEEPDWIASQYSPLDNNIIADGYHFDSAYQKRIKEIGYKLIYIDDLATEHMYADIVINHSPYISSNHFKKEPYTTLALGTAYTLLRPLFLEEAKTKRKIENIDSAFVCFGGADPFNLTIKAVKALLRFSKFKQIHVVLGGAYSSQDIFDVEQEYSDRITIHQNLSENQLIKVMRHSHFAIAPASTILYELCCVKMLILSGFYMNNQELIYKGFLKQEVIYDGGNMKHYQISDFSEKIEQLLADQTVERQIAAQHKLFDANIAERHLNLITGL